MLETLTYSEWCSFIGSIVNPYMDACKRSRVVDFGDLEQQAWQALLLAAQRYQQEKANGKFTSYAWIYISFSVKGLVFPKRKECMSLDSIESFDMEDGHDYFEAVEVEDTFPRVISMLSLEDMELIDQHFVQGITNTDIAKTMGVTKQAVSYKIQSIITTLRKKLSLENVVFN